MKTINSLAGILLVMHSQITAAASPNSCYWCISVGSVWDSKTSNCTVGGIGFTKAEECTSILDFRGLDTVF